MASLPEARVTPSRPFSKTGVDYAGPFILRVSKGRNPKTFKAYVAIFVCFSTRAIHLELVSDMSTDAFLAALRRFISRRGRPHTISSDNGTNFVGASNEMKAFIKLMKSQQHNEDVAIELSKKGIAWEFNPPAAPHMGGLWEAGVKSLKHHLRRVLGETPLNFEKFSTILCQIEAALNSRPLSPASSDPNDFTALSPGHFLIGAPLETIPEPELTELPINRLSRWQLIQQKSQHLWNRWSKEYLCRLQQRPQWTQVNPEVQVGDLVVIRDERMPPQQWKLARVREVFPGSDGHVRSVSLKTSSGTLTRPITKLCQLPIE